MVVRVKRWGKSPPGGVATHRAVRLMGCKVMYTGAVGLLVRCRGVNREELYGDIKPRKMTDASFEGYITRLIDLL